MRQPSKDYDDADSFAVDLDQVTHAIFDDRPILNPILKRQVTKHHDNHGDAQVGSIVNEIDVLMIGNPIKNNQLIRSCYFDRV